MKFSRSLFSWERNKIAYSFALAFFPIVTVLWAIPPHYSWYFWQSNLQVIIRVFFGIFSLIFDLISGPVIYLDKIQFSSVFKVGLVCLLIGLFIQILWRKFRYYVVILYVLNAMCGFTFAYILHGFIGRSTLLCEEKISESQQIKIVEFDDRRYYELSFFASTTNSGDDWQHIMASSLGGASDSKPSPTCKNIRHFDEEFIWIWTSYEVGVSQDGGETWHVWHSNCSFDNCDYHHVLDVKFVNKLDGTITAWRSGNNAEISTVDGGITWTLE